MVKEYYIAKFHQKEFVIVTDLDYEFNSKPYDLKATVVYDFATKTYSPFNFFYNDELRKIEDWEIVKFKLLGYI